MPAKARVAVLGGGAWGSVLAGLAAQHGHDVALWEIDHTDALALDRNRVSKRTVPGFKLPPEVAVFSGFDRIAVVANHDMLVVAVPSGDVADTMRTMAAHRVDTPPRIVVCASKGLEPDRGLTMAEVIALNYPGARVAVLSGPSFAAEIARGLPAALVVASADAAAAAEVQSCFGGDRLRVYTSDDVTGVCVGGALKNVIAIAVGCCDGFGFGDNARAALITRGLAEMGRLAERMGGRARTLAGLAGLGDLVLTCTGDLSRNRQVGLALARGEALDAILGRLGHIAEGVGTARIARDLAQRLGVDMPITREVAAVIHDGKSPRAAVSDLLARDIGAER
ncbi:MAG TPA: NAD(P)H-dependent glycerol-3-phosphate dehydrogenase [Polyangia bacterium]|nr:NAD(P)H-dependent glycerol-3-phosphate dehydrogenase [Polyangia bacterium]